MHVIDYKKNHRNSSDLRLIILKINILLKNKDINLYEIDLNGKNALFYAFNVLGSIEIIKLLIKKDTNIINTKNNYGITPLMMACMNDNIECLELILENTIEISKDNKGNTALMHAIHNNNKIAINKILEKFPTIINETNNNCHSPLMLSIIKNNFPIFRRLKKINLHQFNNKDIDGNNILILSCIDQRIISESEFIKSILTTDIDINCKNNEGNTALMYLCANNYDNDLNVLLLLERKDILINEINNLGKSALMFACDNCNIKIIKLLLNRPYINIHQKDNLGNTILINLCSNKSDNPYTIIELMLSKCIIEVDDFIYKNKQGKSALDYLRSNERFNQIDKDKILELLGMK
jgi:ankyrin repeat protein